MKAHSRMTDTPAPRKRPRWLGLRIVIFFITMGLLLWAMASPFVSSPYGRSIAWAIAVAMGALAGLATWFDPVLAEDSPERTEMVTRWPIMQDRGARTPLLAILWTLITFAAVNDAGLEFWTLAVGKTDEWPLHLGDYRTSSRGNCAGFTLQEAPMKLHRMICATYPHGEDPPEPGTPVSVWGKASDVGIRVERFEIAPDT